MNRKILALLILIVGVNSCKGPHKKTVNKIHVSSADGQDWNVFGVRITGKVLSEETDGKYAVIITETPPNGGPPLHMHTHEDELFYVLEGHYEFYYGDEKVTARKGDFIQLPKGIPHRFVNKDTIVGITMNTITPGGFEKFFDDIAIFSKRHALSKPSVDSIAKKYGIQFMKK